MRKAHTGRTEDDVEVAEKALSVVWWQFPRKKPRDAVGPFMNRDPKTASPLPDMSGPESTG